MYVHGDRIRQYRNWWLVLKRAHFVYTHTYIGYIYIDSMTNPILKTASFFFAFGKLACSFFFDEQGGGEKFLSFFLFFIFLLR